MAISQEIRIFVVSYYDTGDYACNLGNTTLADYTYDGKVSDAELEQAIDDELEAEEFLNYQREYC